MKELSWLETFIGPTSLRDLRTQNNLEIPDWYNKSVIKLVTAVATIFLGLGVSIGLVVAVIL